MIGSPISFDHRPSLKHPVLILAFSGWNDAGCAATAAVRYLTEQLVAAKLGSLDPEEYYDFSINRPQVRLDGLHRQLHWPSYDFYYGRGIGVERDFILGIGAEPHLRWKSFCEALIQMARECHVETIVTLGAYLDEVLYTRPVPLTGFASEERIMREMEIMPSRYQGPTGIVGVLADVCRRTVLPNISLWAALPHYLPVTANPRGALALLLQLNRWLGLRVDTGPLERAAAEFQTKVNEIVAKDPNLAAFIRELKKREFDQ